MNIEFGKRVPCGRCTACRINRGQEWSTRILHEFSQERKGAFLTFTYNDLNMPKGGTLVKAHLQGVLKRMRNYDKFKYYGVGEYGDLSERPHYHIIIIGEYKSFSDCWDFGFSYEGSVTWDSINYVTSYIQKKLYGVKAKEMYGDRLAPFAIMSKNMGLRWLMDKYNSDQVLLHLGVRRHGKTVRAPRYYFKKLDKEIPIDVWNNRAMIISKRLEEEAEGTDPLELARLERETRHRRDVDMRWKKENAGQKGLI